MEYLYDKSTNGVLYLTSRESFLHVSAHASLILLAVRVLPVKLMSLTSGCLTKASPATAPVPNTMLTTPAGTPGEHKYQLMANKKITLSERQLLTQCRVNAGPAL